MATREIIKLKMLKKIRFIRRTEFGLGAGQRTDDSGLCKSWSFQARVKYSYITGIGNYLA